MVELIEAQYSETVDAPFLEMSKEEYFAYLMENTQGKKITEMTQWGGSHSFYIPGPPMFHTLSDEVKIITLKQFSSREQKKLLMSSDWHGRSAFNKMSEASKLKWLGYCSADDRKYYLSDYSGIVPKGGFMEERMESPRFNGLSDKAKLGVRELLSHEVWVEFLMGRDFDRNRMRNFAATAFHDMSDENKLAVGAVVYDMEWYQLLMQRMYMSKYSSMMAGLGDGFSVFEPRLEGRYLDTPVFHEMSDAAKIKARASLPDVLWVDLLVSKGKDGRSAYDKMKDEFKYDALKGLSAEAISDVKKGENSKGVAAFYKMNDEAKLATLASVSNIERFYLLMLANGIDGEGKEGQESESAFESMSDEAKIKALEGLPLGQRVVVLNNSSEICNMSGAAILKVREGFLDDLQFKELWFSVLKPNEGVLVNMTPEERAKVCEGLSNDQVFELYVGEYGDNVFTNISQEEQLAFRDRCSGDQWFKALKSRKDDKSAFYEMSDENKLKARKGLSNGQWVELLTEWNDDNRSFACVEMSEDNLFKAHEGLSNEEWMEVLRLRCMMCQVSGEFIHRAFSGLSYEQQVNTCVYNSHTIFPVLNEEDQLKMRKGMSNKDWIDCLNTTMVGTSHVPVFHGMSTKGKLAAREGLSNEEWIGLLSGRDGNDMTAFDKMMPQDKRLAVAGLSQQEKRKLGIVFRQGLQTTINIRKGEEAVRA